MGQMLTSFGNFAREQIKAFNKINEAQIKNQQAFNNLKNKFLNEEIQMDENIKIIYQNQEVLEKKFNQTAKNFDYLKIQGEKIKGEQNAKIFFDCKILEALGNFNRKMEKCIDSIENQIVNRSGE